MRILVVLLAIITLASRARGEEPREFAERFYRAQLRWKIYGVPTPEESRRISPYFSSEILRVWAVVDQQRNEFNRRFPLDPKQPLLVVKPPWCKEGNVFSSGGEGYSTFAIGRATSRRGRVRVLGHLEFIAGAGETIAWTDTLVLERAGSGWVITDIEFPHGNSLVKNLNKGIATRRKELR